MRRTLLSLALAFTSALAHAQDPSSKPGALFANGSEGYHTYRIPSIMHTPEIKAIIVEHPTADGPYGAKGVGEIVTIPTPPAITNAIYNAVGVRFDSLPVDQEKLLWAMAGK